MPTTRARAALTTGFPHVRRGGLAVAVGSAMLFVPLLPSGTGAQPAPSGHAAALAGNRRCEAPEHRQFDFWIGEWDVRNRQVDPARPGDATLHETGVATNRVYPILDGCAIVEHWEGTCCPTGTCSGSASGRRSPGPGSAAAEPTPANRRR